MYQCQREINTVVTSATVQKQNQRHTSPFKINIMQSTLPFHMLTHYMPEHCTEDGLQIWKLLICHAGVKSNIQENMIMSKFSKVIRVIT